ncbi:hypothetical protein CROQUDRAFT_661807 [Cronartium quercuum f. sp. fusiforme G11]|uniref:Bola-like protein n=1 Tax=Cronartium quercuum f. sp. fusiforme G11 TaxID=708437 RepID=A0A9P6NCC9_9BASI|nr:hypothetical protein CROQUDRAFT_661807 [Cronartium quercuum f. sp. fusiforme G11]
MALDSGNPQDISQTDGKVLSVEASIKAKLTELLQPTFLEVINESHLHAHHSAMRAIGGGSGETHFSVRVISAAFNGLGRLARHRKIYAALNHEFTERGLHALSLKAFTPEENQSEAT